MASRPLPGYIRQRGGGWRVVLCLNGKPQQFGPRTEPILRAGTPEEPRDRMGVAETGRIEESGAA